MVGKIHSDAVKVASGHGHTYNFSDRAWRLLRVKAHTRPWIEECDLKRCEVGPRHLDKASGSRLLKVLWSRNILGIYDSYGPLASVGIILVQQHPSVEITFYPRQVIYRAWNLNGAEFVELPHMVEPILQQTTV